MRILKRLFFLSIILLIAMPSCQKPNDKNAVEFRFDGKNYSYQGYDIIPYQKGQYKMSYKAGDQYLALISYYEDRREFLDSVTIVGTDTVIYQYNKVPTMVFDNGKRLHSNSDNNYFFKGFKSYNRNFGEISEQDAEKNIDLDWESAEELGKSSDNYKVQRYLNGTKYSMSRWSPSGYDKNKDTTTVKVKYIISDGDISQVLLTSVERINEHFIFPYKIFDDLDGDGKADFVLFIRGDAYSLAAKPGSVYERNYWLLFLSSEADPGDLVKHVATRCEFVVSSDGDETDT